MVADLLNPPPQWGEGFDLVLESRIIQSMPLKLRSPAIKAIASFVSPGGILLLITRFRPTEAAPDGPPWPLSEGELSEFITQGLQEVNRQKFVDANNQDVVYFFLEYQKPG